MQLSIAFSHNIQLSYANAKQRTICLKSGKATNRGYIALA